MSTLGPMTPGSYWAENQPAAGTSHALPIVLFPADNWWNLDISGVSVDPTHGSIPTDTYGGSTLYPEFGNNWGMPFCTVSGNYPKVEFAGANYDEDTDFVQYPIPIPALTEYGWTESAGGTPGSGIPISTMPDDGKDHHLLIVDKDNENLYEIYQPFYNAGESAVLFQGLSGQWVQPGEYWCAIACHWHMTTNNQRTEGLTSSDAAGLQVLPGLLQYDEVMGLVGDGEIHHAHRFTLAQAEYLSYVWPARHGTYTGGVLPFGARWRMKAAYDISGFGTNAQRIFRAFKKYGLIFADNGGNGYITGTNDSRWGPYDSEIREELWVAFQATSLSNFEVITLGYGAP